MNTILAKAIKGAVIGLITSKAVDVAWDKSAMVVNKVKNKIQNSENIQEIKKRYKLRSEEGIITVDYEEV